MRDFFLPSPDTRVDGSVSLFDSSDLFDLHRFKKPFSQFSLELPAEGLGRVVAQVHFMTLFRSL